MTNKHANSDHPAYEKIMRNAQRLNPGKNISMAAIGNVDLALLDAYLSGERVRVETTYYNGETYTRTGIVRVTMGWAPTLMLMHRSGSFASSDLLDAGDVVTGVQPHGNKHYWPTARQIGRCGVTARAIVSN